MDGFVDEQDVEPLGHAVALPIPLPEQNLVGPPVKDFDVKAAQDMMSLGLSITDVAKHLHVSRPTLYRRFAEKGIALGPRFNNLSDDELDDLLLDIKSSHPNAGETYLMGHVQAKGYKFPRRRLRASLHRIDEDGVAARRASKIFRREYKVPCPNYLWHIDGDHKLIRWKFVVHSGIDGFSRLVLYLHCSNNNEAATVGELFEAAVERYTMPIRLRTDYGGENRMAWAIMYDKRSVETRPVIAGSSVHNQRIERLHRDVNEQCLKSFKIQFVEMEDDGILNPDNPLDIFCLHFVFLRLINKNLSEFLMAHNHHKISTEKNYTPVQLFALNQHLIPLHETNVMDDPHPGVAPEDLLSRVCPHVQFPSIDCPLSDDEFAEMQDRFDPLTVDDPVVLYKQVVVFVMEKVFPGVELPVVS